jgi:LysM repeat protein
MTVERTDRAPASEPTRVGSDGPAAEPAISALRDLCPFLLAADGGWRSVDATGQHRCTAVYPPAQLTTEKQRRLCLTPDHATCATFVAALEAREPASATRPVDARPIPRTTPVVLERTRFALPILPIRPDRTAGQAALVVLLALAFVGVVLSRPSGSDGTPGGVGGPSVSPAATTPARSPAASAAVVEPSPSSVEPSPTPKLTLVPTEDSPPPSTRPAHYRVKPGDTLSGIAAEYGTTWQVLAELNDIKNPSALRVGTILDLP